MTDRTPLRPSAGRRGQTTLDFVIAIGVFFLVVTFSFSFVSGMLGPFTQDGAKDAVADRVADAVVDDLSDGVERPNRLNATCTEAYFLAEDGADCPFAVETSLADRAGVGDTYHVNVTVGVPEDDTSDLQTLCHVDGAIETCAGDGDRLVAGPSVPTSSTSVATARRTVVAGDRLAVVEVRAWS